MIFRARRGVPARRRSPQATPPDAVRSSSRTRAAFDVGGARATAGGPLCAPISSAPSCPYGVAPHRQSVDADRQRRRHRGGGSEPLPRSAARPIRSPLRLKCGRARCTCHCSSSPRSSRGSRRTSCGMPGASSFGPSRLSRNSRIATPIVVPRSSRRSGPPAGGAAHRARQLRRRFAPRPVGHCARVGSSSWTPDTVDPMPACTAPLAVARVLEKNITLNVAKRVGAALGERGIDVKYTRTTDTLIALSDRGRIANDAQADLFVSIHVNAANRAGRIQAVRGASRRISSPKQRRKMRGASSGWKMKS